MNSTTVPRSKPVYKNYNASVTFSDGQSMGVNAKNLNFVNPTVDVTNTNQYIGVLAGETSYSTDSKAEGANVDNISALFSLLTRIGFGTE